MGTCRRNPNYDCHPAMKVCDLCINNPENAIDLMREAANKWCAIRRLLHEAMVYTAQEPAGNGDNAGPTSKTE